MIKFRAATEKGTTLIGVGLVSENLDRLENGKSIRIKFSELDINADVEICIFYGEDERTLFNILRREGIVTEETEIRGPIPVAEPGSIN